MKMCEYYDEMCGWYIIPADEADEPGLKREIVDFLVKNGPANSSDGETTWAAELSRLDEDTGEYTDTGRLHLTIKRVIQA